MDTKSREALLRTDLNIILRTIVRLHIPDNFTDKLNDLVDRCFHRMCSTVCRRYCGLCFIVASLKWDIPAPFDIFLSMAAQGACESASTIVSSLESLPLSNPAFRLGILGGIVEARNHPILPNTLKANVCQPEVRPALLRSLEQFLCHASTPSITTEAIALLTKLLESTSANGQDKFSEAEAEMLKSSLLCALTHCDDSEQFVINLVSRLFDTIFALVFDNGRVLNTLSHWLLTSVVQEAVLGSPYCLHEAVILTKGALRLLKCLLKYVNLTWLLEKSPHLMTSLILAFAWNYTAAYAGDLVNCILSRCPPFTFVAPLEAFLLHGELDCPLSQQLRHLDETSVDVVTKLRIHNFLIHCAKPSLICMPSEGSDRTFGEIVAIKLAKLLIETSPSTRESLVECRLMVWSAFLPLLPPPAITRLFSEYAEVVLIGLSHSNDLIRAKACAAVCAITSHLPSLHLSCDTPLPLRQLVFTGLVSLLSSPDPTARNTVIHGFVEMSQCVRNRCAALKDHNKGTLHGPAKGFRVAGYPDVQRRFFDLKPVMGIKSPAAVDLCQLEDLDDLLYFASLLWFRCTSDSHTSFIFPGQPPAVDGCVEGDMSTCITELLSTPLFPPGMPYQRQKTLITLLRHMFDLLYFWQPSQQQRPTASAKSIKKVGFEPSTSKNLQERLNQLLSERDFPSPRELSTWLQLIASLPNVNTEVQAEILSIFDSHWPRDVNLLSSFMTDKLVALAECWCDFHVTEAYSAGSILFQWLVTSQPSSPVILGVLLRKIQTLSASIPILIENPNPKESSRIMRCILDFPGHGFLTAINAICSWVGQTLPLKKFPHCLTVDPAVRNEFSARLHPLQQDLLSQDSHLVHDCIHLSNACLALMGCSPFFVDLNSAVDPTLPADAGASSFEVLGRTILTFASKASPKSVWMDSSTTPGLNRQFESRGNEKVLTAIQLLPEYQHILSWAWKTLKLTADVLVTWLYLRVCAFLTSAVDDASSDPTNTLDAGAHRILRLIGNQLIHILIVCRHKGTVESVYQSLQQYLTVTAKLNCFLQSCASNEKTTLLTVARAVMANLIRPEQVIDVCLAALSDCKFSVTRRAAGLWPASKAALLAELTASPVEHPLLARWLSSILTLAVGGAERKEVDATWDSENDPPRALALHLLRGVFGDARLGPCAFTVVPVVSGVAVDDLLTFLTCRVALPGFAAPQWTISNGSLQLFAIIVMRLVGSSYSRPPPSILEVFGRYPALFDTFVAALEEVSSRTTPSCLSSTAKLLVPLLGLLSHLSSSPPSVFPANRQAAMRNAVLPLLGHPVAKIRRLAADVLITFLSPSSCPPLGPLRLLRVTSSTGRQGELNCDSSSCPPSASNSLANMCSGDLALLCAWLKKSPTQLSAVHRAGLFDWSSALSLLRQWSSERSVTGGRRCLWLLAAQLAQLMRQVFTMAPPEPSIGDQMTRFCKSLLTDANYPLGFVCQASHTIVF
uniref:Thyroid adenoma-associated protein homolog n=1 Tax=Schistocephalus solidus TaxID=70667 RepID=A0A0X3P9J3_SCHSO